MSLQIWHFLYELCCLSLLYFANKVNLEKSHKSAKCVCYHQIRATKMEQVINFPASEALQRIDIDCQAFNRLKSSPSFWGEISERRVSLGVVKWGDLCAYVIQGKHLRQVPNILVPIIRVANIWTKSKFGWEVRGSVCIRYSNLRQASWTSSK